MSPLKEQLSQNFAINSRDSRKCDFGKLMVIADGGKGSRFSQQKFVDFTHA
jgi:hypothetical protein